MYNCKLCPRYTTNIYMNIGLVLTIILKTMFDIIGSLHSHGMVPSTTAAHERRSLSRYSDIE